MPPQGAIGKADPKAYAAAKPYGQLGQLFEDAAPSVSKEPVDKVDQNDINNAQAVIAYLGDIHRHYREAEVRARALRAPGVRRCRPPPEPSQSVQAVPMPCAALWMARGLPTPWHVSDAHGSLSALSPRPSRAPPLRRPRRSSLRTSPRHQATPRALTAQIRRRLLLRVVRLAGHQPRVGQLHVEADGHQREDCLLYTSPSPRDS